jgi:hypothetical protein
MSQGRALCPGELGVVGISVPVILGAVHCANTCMYTYIVLVYF